MMNNNNSGVRRPIMYFVTGLAAIALALPLALASGQSGSGGIFDECYEDCTTQTLVANLPE